MDVDADIIHCIVGGLVSFEKSELLILMIAS